MFDHPDDAVERAARHLRRPVRFDPALDAAVMREIAVLPVPRRAGRLGRLWHWLRQPHQLTLTPLGALGTTAALAIVTLLLRMEHASPVPAVPEPRSFQFVLVAPGAHHVSLVGDFNDWDAARTPLERARQSAVWTTLVPLQPGRYRYAFLLDGVTWIADPGAPAARDDEFGTPSSVVTVGGM